MEGEHTSIHTEWTNHDETKNVAQSNLLLEFYKANEEVLQEFAALLFHTTLSKNIHRIRMTDAENAELMICFAFDWSYSKLDPAHVLKLALILLNRFLMSHYFPM